MINPDFASASAAPPITGGDIARHAAKRSRRHAATLPSFCFEPLSLLPRACALAQSIASCVRRRLNDYWPLILDVSTRRAVQN
eukprot:6187123-Pleurochrysis_carterae.AAC.1